MNPPHISSWEVDTALNEVITSGPQKDAAADYLDDIIDSGTRDQLQEMTYVLLKWARGALPWNPSL